jgi:hypothetical protein
MAELQRIDNAWECLQSVAAKSPIRLFVGVGLSIPNELPSWSDLTANIDHNGSHDNHRKRVEQLQERGVPLISQLAILRERYDASQWTVRVRESLYRGFFEQLNTRGELSVAQLRQMERGSRCAALSRTQPRRTNDQDSRRRFQLRPLGELRADARPTGRCAESRSVAGGLHARSGRVRRRRRRLR